MIFLGLIKLRAESVPELKRLGCAFILNNVPCLFPVFTVTYFLIIFILLLIVMAKALQSVSMSGLTFYSTSPSKFRISLFFRRVESEQTVAGSHKQTQDSERKDFVIQIHESGHRLYHSNPITGRIKGRAADNRPPRHQTHSAYNALYTPTVCLSVWLCIEEQLYGESRPPHTQSSMLWMQR